MTKHVKWDVRTGGDGLLHVTRTEVARCTRPDGTRVTRIETDHTKTGITRQ
jgi:hypothetical protein